MDPPLFGGHIGAIDNGDTGHVASPPGFGTARVAEGGDVRITRCRPQDDSEAFADEVLKREKPGDPRAETYQGGAFVHLEDMPNPAARKGKRK